MRWPRILRLLLLAPIFFAVTGCSTLEKRKTALLEVEQQGVSPDLYQRMLDGQKLTIQDFEQLAEQNVSDATVLRYLASTGHVYLFTVQDLERLRQAKVSEAVINYLLSTRNRVYHYAYPPSYYFWDYPRYYYYPYPLRGHR